MADRSISIVSRSSSTIRIFFCMDKYYKSGSTYRKTACLRAEAGDGDVPDLRSCDAVAAGLVFLLVRPQLGKLRERLLQAAVTPQLPFGAYLASHAMLVDDEHTRMLDSIATDSRLS